MPIVRILGNLSVDGCEYEDQGFYDVTDEFIRKNKQNCLTQDKMKDVELDLMKKSPVKKAAKTKSFMEAPADKAMTGGKNK